MNMLRNFYIIIIETSIYYILQVFHYTFTRAIYYATVW